MFSFRVCSTYIPSIGLTGLSCSMTTSAIKVSFKGRWYHFCGFLFSVHNNFTILHYFPLVKVSYCSSFKELSVDVLTLYVAYLLVMLQVQTVSWVKKLTDT